MKVTPNEAARLGCPFKYVPFQLTEEVPVGKIDLTELQKKPELGNPKVVAMTAINVVPERGVFVAPCQGPHCMMWVWDEADQQGVAASKGHCGLASG